MTQKSQYDFQIIFSIQSSETVTLQRRAAVQAFHKFSGGSYMRVMYIMRQKYIHGDATLIHNQELINILKSDLVPGLSLNSMAVGLVGL